VKLLGERARVVGDIHAFFESRGFLHVETPAIVPSPGMDAHLSAFAVDTRQGRRWLATSPEYQMKRLLAEGHERLYQVCRSYRQDEQGHLHNPEFSMLEWYRSGSVLGVMQDTEQLVARVTRGSLLPPFLRMTVCEAFSTWASAAREETLAMAENDEDRFFRLLVDRVEPGLASLERPVFLTEYPSAMASLARKKPDDPRVSERFELYVAGVELCNGFGELIDPVEQRARFEHDQAVRKARDLEVYPIDEKLLEALPRVGPCAGNALGIDRLAMLACGAESIDSVMAFTFEDL
jgi:elongation factor P--(R)-beta-lysine ligase